MMATRLTDSELAQRIRAGNRRRAQRQQEKRRSAGLVQLNVWVSQPIRTALDKSAAHRNMTVSETVSDLLERALSVAMLLDTTTTPYRCLRCDAPIPADCEDAPVCADCNRELNAIAESCNASTTPASNTPDSNATTPRVHRWGGDRDSLMAEVGTLLADGLSGADIARRLNASGQRTANGAAFTSANLLRDYRAWSKKRDVE